MQHNTHCHSFRFSIRGFSMVVAALGLLLLPALPLRAQTSTSSYDQSQAIPPAPPPDAAVTQRNLRLSDVHGDVKVYSGDLLAFPQAFVNMPLVQGMRIVAGDSGRAEIQFADGSVARIAPNSSLLIARLGSTNDGILNSRLEALTGLTYYEFNGEVGNQYTLSVGPETIVPSGNAVIRVDMDNTPYQVADMEGGLQILRGNNLIVSLQSGQSVSFDPSDPQMYQLSDSIPPNSWDQWNSNRDADLAQLASNANQSSSSTNSAWNELNYYGDWYNVPGYGEGWAPAGVGQNWDPYGYGWWGYYPWGYTWISGYPWGWWPYHCGYWNWFSGNGWMWFPGGCGWGGFGGGWYPMAYIQSAPPHYRRLIRPARTAHGPGRRVPRLYPVDRGNQFSRGFRSFGGAKPSPRTFNIDGQNLTPVQAALPTLQFAPVGGGGYTSTAAAAHPGGAPNSVGGSVPVLRAPYRVGAGSPNSGGNRPSGGSRFGSSPRHAPFFRPGNSGQRPNSAPRNGPVFHPAPRPNSGPRPTPNRGPVFRPAPRPAPMPHPTFHPMPHPSAPHPTGRPH